MTKIQLTKVDSGTIDLVFNGQQQLLQFNCNCDDALPYCKAACCRNRPTYNILLTKDEEDKFEKKLQHPSEPKLHILDHVGGHCAYLNDQDLCDVHKTKPNICASWHCSPGGVGEGIEIRDSGWALVPGQGDMQHEELRQRIYDNELDQT